MIPRYEHAGIKAIWTDRAKLARWDRVELAVVEARMKLGLVSEEDWRTILGFVSKSEVDIPAWLEREKEMGHDLAAYVELRWEGLPAELRHHFHDGMTSYDTEDPAFVLALQKSSGHVHDAALALIEEMLELAKRYRYQPMLERTHGQWAKLASLGSRILMWRAELVEADHALIEAISACRRSRISGAIGTYGGRLTSEIEREALALLGLAPYYGAGQIAPRTLYASLAQAEGLVAKVLEKIAIDFQLGARSGCPLWQEPFGRAQKGSSAMPHKKNPIRMEQTEGLAAVASGYVSMIVESAKTKERRDIAQSCVERIAWPDLHHTLMRMLGNVRSVLGGMSVYPENMYREIAESRGTYASEDAKTFLAERLAARGLGAEVAYRIVQLACWNAHPPAADASIMDGVNLSHDLAEANRRLMHILEHPALPAFGRDIESLLLAGNLTAIPQLDVDADMVADWNTLLREVFMDKEMWDAFTGLFTIPYQLQGESHLFELLDS